MIVSRPAELGMLDELVDAVHAGQGRALVVRGEPGIGKTTLLDALVARCGAGATVLRARGIETEAERGGRSRTPTSAPRASAAPRRTLRPRAASSTVVPAWLAPSRTKLLQSPLRR
jgi:ABC-type cobalamin/Fe3+-siderophores transport system ATPase subunit